MTVNGKNILVTGGSRGIGEGIVTFLAHQGARVALTYSSRLEAAQNVLDRLPGEGHGLFKMDISSENSVKEAMGQILDQFQPLDGLVNNAGITSDQILLRMKLEEFDKVIQTNLVGTYLCTQSVLKPMIKAKKGSIVSLTSVIGQRGNVGQCNYAASKAGIEAFSKSVAQEVASRGIRVNCIAPGFIQTEMTDQLNENQKKAILDAVPMKRMGEVQDVASVVAFLLSDDSTYLTGQTISVNGGL